mmetsp:Transcript_102112/g.289186  ORF Transcript_102112/g.289186 Transcript_102112/m.289186 type:complete len:218 (-) Transcript_102112:141-794(-)
MFIRKFLGCASTDGAIRREASSLSPRDAKLVGSAPCLAPWSPSSRSFAVVSSVFVVGTEWPWAPPQPAQERQSTPASRPNTHTAPPSEEHGAGSSPPSRGEVRIWQSLSKFAALLLGCGLRALPSGDWQLAPSRMGRKYSAPSAAPRSFTRSMLPWRSASVWLIAERLGGAAHGSLWTGPSGESCLLAAAGRAACRSAPARARLAGLSSVSASDSSA